MYYLLEAEGFKCMLANARKVKNVPGRPKTDKIDSVWLCKVAERGMFRPSLVHPEPIRRLRDGTFGFSGQPALRSGRPQVRAGWYGHAGRVVPPSRHSGPVS